jgi:hypothetical protein
MPGKSTGRPCPAPGQPITPQASANPNPHR